MGAWCLKSMRMVSNLGSVVFVECWSRCLRLCASSNIIVSLIHHRDLQERISG